MGKTIVGALVGVVVGIIVLVAFGLFRIDSLWPAIIMGALSGWCMRKIALGGNPYLKGALSAATVLLAVVGGKLVLAQVLQSTGPKPVIGTGPQAPPVAQKNDEAASEEVEEAPVAEPQPMERAPVTTTMNEVQGTDISPLDAIFLVIGALVAYQVGKDEKHLPKTDSNDSAPSSDSPPGEQKLVYPE